MLKLPSASISKDERVVFNSFAIIYWPVERFDLLEGGGGVFWAVGGGVCWGCV